MHRSSRVSTQTMCRAGPITPRCTADPCVNRSDALCDAARRDVIARAADYFKVPAVCTAITAHTQGFRVSTPAHAHAHATGELRGQSIYIRSLRRTHAPSVTVGRGRGQATTSSCKQNDTTGVCRVLKELTRCRPTPGPTSSAAASTLIMDHGDISGYKTRGAARSKY